MLIESFVWWHSHCRCHHGLLKNPNEDFIIAGWSDVPHSLNCHHLFSSQLSSSLLPMSSHQMVSSRMSVCKHLLVLLSLITKLSVNKVLTGQNCEVMLSTNILMEGMVDGCLLQVLVYGSSSLGVSPCQCHFIVFLGKKCFSHCTSLHPVV